GWVIADSIGSTRRAASKIRGLQQSAGCKTAIIADKRAVALLVPKSVFSWNWARWRGRKRKVSKQRRYYCVGAHLEAGRRICFVMICFVICTGCRIGVREYMHVDERLSVYS